MRRSVPVAALLAGDPLGIESDCTECQAHGATVVDQLEHARIGWRAYMEGMPAPCYAGASAGGYAKKHDPFMYFSQIASNPARCGRVVPLTALTGDLRGGALPAFAWITPNLCDDGHDCVFEHVRKSRLTGLDVQQSPDPQPWRAPAGKDSGNRQTTFKRVGRSSSESP